MIVRGVTTGPLASAISLFTKFLISQMYVLMRVSTDKAKKSTTLLQLAMGNNDSEITYDLSVSLKARSVGALNEQQSFCALNEQESFWNNNQFGAVQRKSL